MSYTQSVINSVLSLGQRVRPFIPPIVANSAGQWLRDMNYLAQPEGSVWDEVGALQLQFLRGEGLRPHHRLLDVGCGAGRAGWRFANYLNHGNYYDVDKRENRIRAAREQVFPDNGLDPDTATFALRGDFDFSVFDAHGEFEYAIAQSAFTHVDYNTIVRCLVEMEDTLAPDGAFYATIFAADEPFQIDPCQQPTKNSGTKTTYFDQNNYHYHPSDFEALCSRLDDLSVEFIGDWGHPRNQQMLKFTV
jgi:SAM-dependent methyltransferase